MTVRETLVLLACAAAALGSSLSCATRDEPAAVARTQPGISWELHTGDRRGDEHLVCQSGGKQPCVLDSTTDTRRTLALVEVHLPPVDRHANYVGTVRAPFIEGISDLGELSVAVPPKARPVSRTILGRVTRQPGSYTMTLSLDAFVQGSAAPVRLHVEIPVTVR